VTPEECLVIYGEAWFERDPVRRVEILRRCCTEDIVFMDPRLGRLHGLDAVSDMIEAPTSARSPTTVGCGSSRCGRGATTSRYRTRTHINNPEWNATGRPHPCSHAS
jgi:hypothetical protein